jgi:hypothetical protein
VLPRRQLDEAIKLHHAHVEHVVETMTADLD